MPSVDDIIGDILRREGGFVNDPDDPGGATNHGVTIHTMKRLGVDVDGDGDTDINDVRQLTRDRAAEIYREHYYIRPGIAGLPQPLQASVFDMYVNAGGGAITILQKLLIRFGYSVSVDGALGPQTTAAANAAFAAAPEHLVDAYGIARRNYYYSLADNRVASRKYARRRDGGKGGWITRAEEFISERFQYSNEQHIQRVAAWGG